MMTNTRFRPIRSAALLRSSAMAATLAAFCGSGALAQEAAPEAAASFPRYEEAEAHFQFLDDACIECHNFEEWAGGVAFDTMDPAYVAEEAEVWEEAVRKLRGGLMPPPSEERPDPQQVRSFVSWMEAYLDHAAQGQQRPGHVVLHRLNRTEYANAIRDLIGLEVDAAALLPKDDISDGFDNIADVLKVSPSFLDQYISAARSLSVEALGDRTLEEQTVTLRPEPGVDQSMYVEGLPLGTRGGMLAEHVFPADGEYILSFNVGGGFGGGGADAPHQFVGMLDGEIVHEAAIGGEEDSRLGDMGQVSGRQEIAARFSDIRVNVAAGKHQVGGTFIARTYAASDAHLENFGAEAAMPGPINPSSGIGPSPSRDKIFECYPQSTAQELPCATEILSTLARRAFRRPVTDADMEAPMRFYQTGYQEAGFEEGISQGMMAILASPKFLYRAYPAPEGLQPGDVYDISDMELATRLSFFLWSSLPDDELLETAESGDLRDPDVLRAQVQRMLADPRSESLSTNFGFQWLDVNGMDEIDPDPVVYPNFDGNLRIAFREEMRLFLNSVIQEDRSVMDFLNADYTYLNERLAKHYGVPNVTGNTFRRVALQDESRWGLLGKGAVLLTTSYANRTAPVLRGAFLLENVVGAPPAAPPPDVEALAENEEGAPALTVRERMIAHRAADSCNSCHGLMDPLGLALENFDAIGAWQSKDRFAGSAIDATGELPDGTALTGPADLRRALTADPSQFVQTVTEKLMTFALGRSIEPYDMPTVRAIARQTAEHEYRFSEIVFGIVSSDAFQKSMVPDASVAEEIAEETQEAALQ
jgi:mono/diheme cytochrome c family protein